MPVIHSSGIEIRTINTGPYDNNTYILVCPSTKESVIIDTPAEPEKILALTEGTDVKGILITHCHMDHILGHREIKEATGAPVWVHESEADQLPLSPEHYFQHGGEITFGTLTLRAIHVPGHTTGGTSLAWGDHLFFRRHLVPQRTWEDDLTRKFPAAHKGAGGADFRLARQPECLPGTRRQHGPGKGEGPVPSVQDAPDPQGPLRKRDLDGSLAPDGPLGSRSWKCCGQDGPVSIFDLVYQA